MITSLNRIIIITVAAATAIGLTLSGCVGDAEPELSDADCDTYADYGTFDGEEVSISGTIVEVEADRLVESWSDFASCTGIDIDYQGTQEFEANIRQLAEGGNPPVLGIFPQPGLFADLASSGFFKPAPEAVEANVDEFWSEDWKAYGTIDGTFYGAPLMASIKGYVWYSPAEFEEKGYEIPTTLDELNELADTIAAEGDHKPWCASYASDAATGWPVTDWIEDYVLREQGPEVYDQWYKHEIPFNDPKVLDVLKTVGSILKNPKYVNAGIGDVKSIATTAFQKGGLPIETGKCMMHAQANFYAANWDKGTTVAKDGDVFAFYEPTMSDQFGNVTEVGGEFVGAFADRPEVEAVQLYLASGEWATAKAKLNAAAHTSGWATANKAVDTSVFVDPIDKLSVQILTDPKSISRFDASDLMPSEVGAGSFWKEMTQWILGQDDQTTLNNIENSWP
jgi:alpha-glucoside transport system substrate-binding protein